jgi:hypothetical protein
MVQLFVLKRDGKRENLMEDKKVKKKYQMKMKEKNLLNNKEKVEVLLEDSNL